jgi:leucyl-tRNA synthetase
VEKYGADTARFFIASDNPPERDMEWSEEGVSSSHKFLNKLFIFLTSLDVASKEPDIKHIKTASKLIFEYEKDIESVAFNKAIARIREFSNLLFDLPKEEARFLTPYLLSMLTPFVPHLALEVADVLGLKIDTFPNIDKKFLDDDTCIIAVQVNGKLRGSFEVKKGLSVEEVRAVAMEDALITKHLEGKEIKKEIFVKDKILNFVV